MEQSAAELHVLGIDVTNMEEHQKKALEDLVQECSDVFSTGKQDLGWTDWVYHSIYTGNQAPIKQAPHRLPNHYKQEVDQILENALARSD